MDTWNVSEGVTKEKINKGAMNAKWTVRKQDVYIYSRREGSVWCGRTGWSEGESVS